MICSSIYFFLKFRQASSKVQSSKFDTAKRPLFWNIPWEQVGNNINGLGNSQAGQAEKNHRGAVLLLLLDGPQRHEGAQMASAEWCGLWRHTSGLTHLISLSFQAKRKNKTKSRSWVFNSFRLEGGIRIRILEMFGLDWCSVQLYFFKLWMMICIVGETRQQFQLFPSSSYSQSTLTILDSAWAPEEAEDLHEVLHLLRDRPCSSSSSSGVCWLFLCGSALTGLTGGPVAGCVSSCCCSRSRQPAACLPAMMKVRQHSQTLFGGEIDPPNPHPHCVFFSFLSHGSHMGSPGEDEEALLCPLHKHSQIHVPGQWEPHPHPQVVQEWQGVREGPTHRGLQGRQQSRPRPVF